MKQDLDFIPKILFYDYTKKKILVEKKHNILICDSSGSMGSYWAKIAREWNKLVENLDGSVSIILFSDKIVRYPGKVLPYVQINSGSTNIIKALEELEKELKKYKKYDYVRVYFITDGADSNGLTFQSIVIKQDFGKNPQSCFISYNTKK